MSKLRDRLIYIFFEDDKYEENEEIVIDPKVERKRKIIAFSVIINFIINVLYVSFVCYSGYTRNIGIILFVISFIWTVFSLVSSYKLYGKYSGISFYINLFLILFLSKIWFVYF